MTPKIPAGHLIKGDVVVGIGEVDGIEHIYGNEFRAVFKPGSSVRSKRYTNDDLVEVEA